MRMHRPAIVVAALLLGACNSQEQADAPVAAPAAEAAPLPVETPPPAPPPPAIKREAASAAWRALGTEPFWGVQVQGGNLVFTTPEDLQGQVLPASMRREGEATVYAGGDAARTYRLTLTPGECSDGMSDRVFAHKAEFVLGDARYAGCAAARGEPWGE